MSSQYDWEQRGRKAVLGNGANADAGSKSEASLLMSLNLASQSFPAQSRAATTNGLVLADKIATVLQ